MMGEPRVLTRSGEHRRPTLLILGRWFRVKACPWALRRTRTERQTPEHASRGCSTAQAIEAASRDALCELLCRSDEAGRRDAQLPPGVRPAMPKFVALRESSYTLACWRSFDLGHSGWTPGTSG